MTTTPLTGRHILVARAGLRLKRETLAEATGLPVHKLMDIELGRRTADAEARERIAATLDKRFGAELFVTSVTLDPNGPDDGALFRMARAALGKTVKEIVAMRGTVAYETLLALENGKSVREASSERMLDFYAAQGVHASFEGGVNWAAMAAREAACEAS